MIRLIMLTDFTETFSHRLLRGILGYARQSREQWVVCRMPLSFQEQRGIDGVLQWGREWRADAILGKFSTSGDVWRYAKEGLVVVAQDHYRLVEGIPNLTSDYRATGRLVAEYFLERGFKNFAFCGYADTVWSQERCEGFKQRLEEKEGCGFSRMEEELADQPWQTNDMRLIHWLRTLPEHTAVMCCDDRQASSVLMACDEAGIKVPQDMAVMGVDNDDLCDEFCCPTLSSVNLDIEHGGFEAARVIEGILRGERGCIRDILIPTLGVVTRGSTNTFAVNDPYVEKAVDIIHDNLTRSFSVGGLTKLLPLSRRLLEIRFKQATGKTLHEYITDRRIDYFASLLLQSNEPVKVIALRLAFNNYGNLSRVFRERMGCSPTEYRIRHKRHFEG